MWLYFALAAPFFFAIVHIIDSYCVDELLDKPWMGSITGAIATTLTLPFLLPLSGVEIPPQQIILFGITAGILIQISQVFYFYALSYSEVGIVAAYWNMIPAILPLMSIIILGRILTLSQYLGIGILIFSSTYMLLLDSEIKTRIRTFQLMIIACFLQACSYLLQDTVFDYISFFQGFLLLAIGIIIGGLLPLLFKRVRKELISNGDKILLAGKLFILVEFINIVALAFAQKAISLGDPSLVSAAETTIPAFAFLISLLLLRYSKNLGDQRSKEKLIWKMACIALMILGVALISKSTTPYLA